MADEEDVRRIALALPGTVQEGFAFAVREKGYAWSYMERVAPKQPRVRRPDVLVVRVADQGEKQALLAADPAKFFTTPHYNGYPAVLVRLPMIDTEELQELLIEAWRTRATRALVAEYEAQRQG